MRLLPVFLICLAAHFSLAHGPHASLSEQEVLANLNLLKALGIPVLAQDEVIGVGYARLSPRDQERVLGLNHKIGHCAGFEVLPSEPGASILSRLQALKDLRSRHEEDLRYEALSFRQFNLTRDPRIEAALQELREDNLRDWVTWLSSFPTRDNRESNPNVHVEQLADRLRAMFPMFGGFAKVDLIDHVKTRQRSIRVSLRGSSRPDEIVVLGGHLDSISQSWGGGRAAPGADDNASGSANLIEVLRVLHAQGQPERTVEFFWYAGEESGLLGSAEIAQTYKNEKKNVIAVLQLDMTLHPGAGEFVIGNVTDFTSPVLRDFLVAANQVYLNVQLVDDKCGYACSDHASWYRQGYPTLLPFEATTKTMNKNIHSANDKILPTSSFRHSLVFSKIGLIFAMTFN